MKIWIVSSLGCGNYSRVETIQGRKLFVEIRKIAVVSQWWELHWSNAHTLVINRSNISLCQCQFINTRDLWHQWFYSEWETWIGLSVLWEWMTCTHSIVANSCFSVRPKLLHESSTGHLWIFQTKKPYKFRG